MAHEKRLLVDVFQAYFYRKDAKGNRQLVFMSENLTSGGIVSAQDNTDVRNGQGNTLFAVLPGNKDVTVNLTENVFSFEALKVNAGGSEIAGAAEGITSVKNYRAGAAKLIDVNASSNDYKAFKLERVPTNVSEVSIQIGEEVLENGHVAGATTANLTAGQFLVTDENGDELQPQATKAYILLHEDDAEKLAKERAKVMPFVYNTAQTAQTLVISAKEFAQGGELWLQTIEKDEKQKATAYVYFVFENAMPEGNFEISTQSEVQPSDMTVNMRILANEDGELYRIVREPIV